jgi:hypothetical protein
MGPSRIVFKEKTSLLGIYVAYEEKPELEHFIITGRSFIFLH